MCVAVPGRIIEIVERDGGRMALVDVAGVVREASTALVPDLEVGEYTMVHMGYALERLDPEHANETLHLMEEAGVIPPSPDATA
jgi:hydrogenase expression/formation protein HypC